MKFADFWTEETEGRDAPAGDVPPLPDGLHVGTVGHVSIRDVEWKKSPANTDGTCLNLRIDVAGHQAAWDDIPVQMRNIVEAVCRSARVQLPSPDDPVDSLCKALKGQTVSIETISGVSKGGRPYVRISKYRPSSDPLPKDLPKSSRPPKREPVTSGPADDIPF